MTPVALRRSLLLVALLAAAPASAHPGLEHVHDIASGFLHPVTGLDHVLAMVSVGLFAAPLGERARWLVPASFLGMMAVGAVLAMTGTVLPFIETGIALSVLVLGAALALGWTAPVGVAMGLVGAFAVFHGQAHGAELPLDAGVTGFAAGFLAATALLHAFGVTAGLLGPRAVRLAGSAVALAGMGLLAGVI